MPQAWRVGRHRVPGALAWGGPLLALLVAACLGAGLTGGLMRMGLALPWSASGWVGHAAAAHAALMIPAFFATVIGIERAVAVKLRWAFCAPVASGLAGVGFAAGYHQAGAWSVLVAALVFVAVNMEVVRRQAAVHTWLLLASAGCLLAGNGVHVAGGAQETALAFWFAFLVMTIAAERLEMTRLMRRRPGAQAALVVIVLLLVAAPALSLWIPIAGGVLYGAMLLLLAGWLAVFDIARRTVRANGLSRYMALCLLAGYGWLAAAGIAWMGCATGLPWRDLALHGLGLGFVFSMVLGHAPVILPAVARIKLAFHWLFYLPLVVLHLSLLWRFGPGGADFAQRGLAGLWNAGALAIFGLTLVFAALRWRQSHGR